MEEHTFNTHEDWRARGFFLRQPPVIISCYDPAGDGDDRDALLLLSREEHQKGEPWDPDFAVAMKFRVLAAQRLPPEFEFPDKLARLLGLHRQLVAWTNAGRAYEHFFAIETNGVGWAAASALRNKLGNRVIPYTTVGATSEKPYEGGKVSMPRLAALDNVRVLMETHHLKIAPDAPGGKELAGEMASFVWRRPGRPEAMEGQHDDLVMALTGGCWIGSKIIGPTLKAVTYTGANTRRRVN